MEVITAMFTLPVRTRSTRLSALATPDSRETELTVSVSDLLSINRLTTSEPAD